MMRITQEDRLDLQPLHDGALTLVADLRLDNREALADALSIDAERLVRMADSDLLLAAYCAWGADCVNHLVGDFAFAVWDAGARSLTLGVDHMGQRHLFYHEGDGFFAFASEIKGLWALPDVPRTLAEETFTRALLFEGPKEAGTTDYVGIRALSGGTLLKIDANGRVSRRRYWEPRADPAHIGRDEAYYVETYRAVLSEAVACRLRRAAVGAGLLMGGGFDSSAICALAGPVVGAQGRKLIAVSSVMPEGYDGPITHARRWCEMCRRDMPHLDMRYVSTEMVDAFSFMERSFLAGDGRHSIKLPATHQIFAEIAASGARIVMDGHGGDYTLNPRGRAALARMLMTGRFWRFLAEFRAMQRHLGQSARQTLWRNLLMDPLYGSWAAPFVRRRQGLAAFGPTMPLAKAVVARHTPRPWWRSWLPIVRHPRHDMLYGLRVQQDAPAQTYSISGAAHGLEFTQPFHDKRVVELGLAIPETLHVKNGRTRHLARTALGHLYPAEYQHRRPGSDSMIPGFLEMTGRAAPQMLAEIDRMEKAGRLSDHFDFPRMRAMLSRGTVGGRRSGSGIDTGQAVLAFLSARYLEWFRGDNR